MKKVLYFLYKIKIWILSNYYILCPQKGTYKGLYRYKDVFGEAKYIRIRNRIFGRAEKKINRKKNKSIRIMMAFCGEWCATEIYNYFDEKGMDIAVVLTPYFNSGQENLKKEYIRNREFCEARGFRYIDAFDTETWEFKGDIRNVQGDVVVYVKPWMAHYAEQTSLYNMPLSSISCYIPYGFMLSKGETFQFNQRCHNMFTHIYCESEIHRQMYKEYCDIGNSHVEFSGYPKMDPFVVDKATSDKDIWKGLSDHSQKTKIIYSPHWNFQDGYATFMDNGLAILQYAEAHSDTTSWIYKPHPHLEGELISRGYMSASEYQDYVDRWRNLPNGKVYLSGDYTDLFRSSDCIINDSISFIAEYMYTHKPMLLLQNESVEYNSFGQKSIENVYTCRGSDIECIVKFIENVRCGNDKMKLKREQFFDTNLNYFSIRGRLAHEYIILRLSHIIGI